MVAQNAPHTPMPDPHRPNLPNHSSVGRFDSQEADRIQTEQELTERNSVGQVPDQTLNRNSDPNLDPSIDSGTSVITVKANVPLVDQARSQSIQLRGQKQQDFISS